MRFIMMTLGVLILGLSGSGAEAAPPDSTAQVSPGEGHFLGRPRVDLLYVSPPLRTESAPEFRFDLQYDLLSRPDFGPRVVELSRLEQVVYAADRGANYGLMLGGLGNLLGLWSEETALAIMGAGAALGTAWGVGVGADDSSLRYRLEWEH